MKMPACAHKFFRFFTRLHRKMCCNRARSLYALLRDAFIHAYIRGNSTTCACCPHSCFRFVAKRDALSPIRNCVAISRREFLQSSGAAAAALGLVSGKSSLLAASPSSHLLSLAPFTQADPAARELAMLAIDAAKTAGASYADARISRNNVRNISTRETRVLGRPRRF